MRLIEAFESSESAVALLRARDASCLAINPSFERITGYRREQVIGHTPFELNLWPDPAFRTGVWEEIRAERRAVATAIRIRRADGQEMSARLNVEFVTVEGEPALFCLLHDVAVDAGEFQDRRDSLYRSLFLSAAEGIYRSLPGGGFIDVNPAMARILGFDSPDALLLACGRDVSALYPDWDALQGVYDRLAGGRPVEQVRLRMRRQDGSLIWVSENARAIFGPDGEVQFYEGSLIDVTAEVEARDALEQSQSLYRVLVENSRDGVFLIQHGKLLFANQALADILGYRAADMIGMDYMEMVMPEDRAAQWERYQAREAGSEELQEYELHLRHRDGPSVLVEVLADAVKFRGENASTGTLRDVTEERQRQRAIVEAERRYREVFENSPAGLFRSSFEGEILEVNPILARMLGYVSVEQLKAEVPDIRAAYADPTERDQLVQRVVEQGSFSDYETRLRTREGGARWVSVSVRIIRDAQGQPPHFTGSIVDIEDRHAMQAALLRSENQYRTLVEHSQVGVFILRDERYSYVNGAFARMLGYDESDIVGRYYREFMAPEAIAASELREQLRKAGEGGVGEFESCLLHRDGQRVYVRVSNGPVQLEGVQTLTGTVLDITRQREAEERLRFHATHDPLTGLPNRSHFNRRLAEAMLQAVRQGGRQYAVLFLDLDGFKWVNDSLGHGAGDRLLNAIARRLEDSLIRDVLIARYGGDEFTLLPDGECDAQRAEHIAKAVLAVFEQPFLVAGQQVFSSASVGIVLGGQHYESPDQVLRDADTAMYRAKAAGKSGYVVFDEAMHQEALSRLQLETDIRLALERNEFCLHFQPIIELETGRIAGAEALVRWQHPMRGLLPPIEFLAVAEETGLIVDLDNWVLAEACATLAGWRARLPTAQALTLNVNVDERQMSLPDIAQRVQRLLDQHGLPAASIRLEVTETAFRAGRGLAEQRLLALKAVGVGLVVDDFGTGYSSLESFASSPFDALKIDQVFVRDVTTNPRHRAIVRTITAFAEELSLVLTAEGIETVEQRELLRATGCQYAQGFLFARALTPEDFEQLLGSDRAL